TRRAAMQTLAAASAAVVCPDLFASKSESGSELVAVAKKVHPKLNWSHTELNEFLRVLPPRGLKSMGAALDMPSDFDPRARNAAIADIKKELLWVSSHSLTYM